MSAQTGTGTFAGTRANRIAAVAFGAVFVLVGLLGFTVSGGHTVVGHAGGQLLGLFQVNALHNLVHVAVGAVMIGAGMAGARAAKLVNTAVGATYLVLFVIGLFIVGDNPANLIALNAADNALHLVLGAVLLGVGLRLDRD